MMVIPDWVKTHKRPNTEIKAKGDRYYLYEVSSFWDKNKGRAQKKSGAYLGRITESGFIPKHRNYKKSSEKILDHSSIAVKEYGASFVLYDGLSSRTGKELEELFPDYWREILVISILRVIHQCPIKIVYIWILIYQKFLEI